MELRQVLLKYQNKEIPFPPGFVVSCQANPGNALYGSQYMQRMAVAAEKGGAVAIRANGPEDIAAIKQAVSIPIIGINRIYEDNSEVYITPGFREASVIQQAGADIIAFDATARERPHPISIEELVLQLKSLGLPLMADISNLQEGLKAAQMQVDLIATTLSGYTTYTQERAEKPDMVLVQDLAERTDIPIIAEGRIETPEEAASAMQSGAYAVVVGRMITMPEYAVSRFVKAIESRESTCR